MLIDKGWAIIKGVCRKEQIEDIESLIEHNNTSENKKFFLFPRNLFKHQVIKPIIQLMHKEAEEFTEYSKLKLDKIWFVHTLNENSKDGELPYVPHFDKRRYLKLMVYLTDVSEFDGPFTTASVPVVLNEEKRLKLEKNSAEENLIVDKINYKKITLKAGDGIIFDTNCPHYASPVDVGGERKILRLDFQKMQWNDHLDSFNRRILKRII